MFLSLRTVGILDLIRLDSGGVSPYRRMLGGQVPALLQLLPLVGRGALA